LVILSILIITFNYIEIDSKGKYNCNDKEVYTTYSYDREAIDAKEKTGKYKVQYIAAFSFGDNSHYICGGEVFGQSDTKCRGSSR